MTSVVSAEATERIASDLVQLLHQGAPAEELALRGRNGRTRRRQPLRAERDPAGGGEGEAFGRGH